MSVIRALDLSRSTYLLYGTEKKMKIYCGVVSILRSHFMVERVKFPIFYVHFVVLLFFRDPFRITSRGLNEMFEYGNGGGTQTVLIPQEKLHMQLCLDGMNTGKVGRNKRKQRTRRSNKKTV
jgi:hypothetical protein